MIWAPDFKHRYQKKKYDPVKQKKIGNNDFIRKGCEDGFHFADNFGEGVTDVQSTLVLSGAESAWDIPYLNRKISLFHYQILL